MRIGIPRESRPGETLVAATAKTASQLAALGYDVVVEQGAGAAADQPDTAFAEAGVQVGSAEDVWGSDVVVKVNAPTDDEVARLRRGATVISLMAPARSPELVERLSAALDGRTVPAPLFSQHLKGGEKFADGSVSVDDILVWRVTQSLSAYHEACRNPDRKELA